MDEYEELIYQNLTVHSFGENTFSRKAQQPIGGERSPFQKPPKDFLFQETTLTDFAHRL